MISRCAVANSSDDIVITALDAVHWTISAWAAVTQLTISNNFQATGFKPSLKQETTKWIKKPILTIFPRPFEH